MKIATWNVNSAKARLPLITDWLRTASPDVVLFQEIKCETAAFPAAAFEDLGYHVNAVGQKAYNGVALLSKAPAEDVLTRLPGEPEDEQARYVEATVSGVRIASLYLPNGNPVPGEKFAYKLRWMDRLYDHASKLLAQEIPVVLGGDYNIIPEPRDVYSPQAFAGDALFRPESKARFRALLNLGLTEAYRALHDDDRAYTFWDYQAGSWPRDNGLRIDHFLLSPQATDRLADCTIDRGPRGLEKASDHTPVILELRDA
ncbi:exodeoxyribonuclease III [Azospirillum palustre]|uniref:Exodeoxyribonuclease III n=1 Tax=Azospirillum palustre TaxID=2044885 RepID=A0A2B8B5G2_9PROT|nr:exodeoxyribonuclease III [Azospirillum palustre]PGH56524.1 exodeoxyribonuclease III [Azospirillum palustre]